MDIKSQKARARLQARQARRTAFHRSAGPELLRYFPAERFKGAVIAGFWPLKGEIDVRPLLYALHDMGHQLALPCTPRVGKPLVMRAWSPEDELKIGSFDTREPFSTRAEIRPDVVLMPLLAFTKTGERLGYGGGFYDRTLEGLRSSKSTSGDVFTCGVAFAGQEAAFLPTNEHDQRLDAILTENYFKDF